jgi:hypothetical protein
MLKVYKYLFHFLSHTIDMHAKASFPLQPYRTETYWKEVNNEKFAYQNEKFAYQNEKFAYQNEKFVASQLFGVYYGSINQSTFTKFKNLKMFLIRFGKNTGLQ